MKVSSVVSLFTLVVGKWEVSGFAPQTDGTAKLNSRLFSLSSSEINILNERSEALPFAPRPQNCKGYVGDVGFDPFSFSEKCSMEYLREAEIKHGRVCMLAWTGWVAVDLGLRIYPIPEAWRDLTSLSAHDALVTMAPEDPQGFWGSPLALLLYAIGIPELVQWESVGEMIREGKSDRVAGDLNCDVLGFLKGKTPEEVNVMKLKELKHARLGMLAFAGVVTQSAVMGAAEFPYISFPTTA